MSMRVCKVEVYKFKNKEGKTIPDYAIMNTYDGKFLEWVEVVETGTGKIDVNIGCDGSVIVHKRSQAKKIIDKFEEYWRT